MAVDTERIAVRRLAVRKLFGVYNYDIEPTDPSNNQLWILYGNNGSGKTTILSCLYSILAPETYTTNPSAANYSKFESFSVWLTNGISCHVSRPKNVFEGGFTYLMKQDESEICSVVFKIPDDSDKPLSASSEGQYHRLISTIAKLNLGTFFVSDDRKVRGSIFERDSLGSYRVRRVRALQRSTESLTRREDPLSFDLEIALGTAESWLQAQYLGVSSRGDANVSSIYAEIARLFLRNEENTSTVDAHSYSEIVGKIEGLEKASEGFAEIGISAEFKSSPFVQVLKSASATEKGTFYKIIKPYIDSVSARFEAIGNFTDLTRSFLKEVNRLLADKHIEFNVREGISIISDRTGEVILPKWLSRGEKQLLLLLCYTLSARDRSSIFVIDEPEISLNIKWQRQLIRSLLSIIRDSNIQFFMATHSIELLTQHKQFVRRLKETD